MAEDAQLGRGREEHEAKTTSLVRFIEMAAIRNTDILILTGCVCE